VGFQARSAIPALKEGLQDPDANIRTAFQDALDRMESAREGPGQEDEAKRRLAILKELNEFSEAARGK